jgi:5-methylcytosine-specific restriction endonuclease McrA
MTQAIKTTYDTLTTGLRRVPDGDRTPAHYLERWRRRHGLLPQPGGGRIEKFRRIIAHQAISVADILADHLPRVMETEYHWYRWNVGKVFCVYCNRELDRQNRTRDHVVPRARGGGRLGRDNLQPACPECNANKGDKMLLEFLVSRSAA